MQYVSYYVEANIACSLILAIILLNEVRNKNRQDRRIVFSNTIVFHMLYFWADCIWIMVDGNVIPKTPYSLALINYVILILIEACTFFWFLYGEICLHNKKIATIRGRVIASLPLLVVSLLFLIRFLAGDGYYIDDNDVMHHPYLYYSTLILPFVYIIYTSIRCLKSALRKDNYADRSQLLSLSLYPIVLMVAGIIQIFNQRMPYLCFGVTFVVIYVYIISLDNMISSDPLTKLNNRNQLNRFIQQKERERSSFGTETMYVMMIDVNKFKNINDTYGHTEGDRALQVIAEVLRGVCGCFAQKRPFLARYGGDEFIIAAHVSSDSELQQISSRIREDLLRACKENDLPYELTVSIGWADFKQMDTLKSCIRRADEAMYREKQSLAS